MIDEGFGYTSSLSCRSETRDCVFPIYVDCQILKRTAVIWTFTEIATASGFPREPFIIHV